MISREIQGLTDMPKLDGARVIVRASLDVPIKAGVVRNHFRVVRAVPTIAQLIEKGARVIILTHVGRNPKNSTFPLLDALKKHILVAYVQGVVGEEVLGRITHMKEGSALLLENVRSCPEEEDNNDDFAKTLASYADYYVNDAFAVSHRAHASIVGIPKYIPGFAGSTFMEEYTELKKALTPQHPSLFILGGEKYETKAPLIEAYSNEYTHSFIGGALANDFLKGKGYEVGESRISPISLQNSPILKKKNVLLPVDVIAVKGGNSREVMSDAVLPDEKILDVGSKTIDLLAPYIKDAKTILWNGPLGNYEDGYDTATKACAKLIAESGAFSVVGGGDTIAAIESLGLSDSFGFLSTAGGAMLEFLEKRTLPGIEALKHVPKS